MILLILIAWPLLEIAAAIAVADAIGVLYTILALVITWPLGTWLMRREGRAVVARLRAAFAGGSRRGAGPEIADGALALLAGPLLIVPGFITDALGLLLLVGAVRRRLAVPLVRALGARWPGRRFARPGRPVYDVDSTASETTPRRPMGDRPQLHG